MRVYFVRLVALPFNNALPTQPLSWVCVIKAQGDLPHFRYHPTQICVTSFFPNSSSLITRQVTTFSWEANYTALSKFGNDDKILKYRDAEIYAHTMFVIEFYENRPISIDDTDVCNSLAWHTADRYINCHNEADEIVLKTANQPQLTVRGRGKTAGQRNMW
jgi:hypothetical protein